MPNRIDHNASSADRVRRTIQRLSQGAATYTIKTTLPITGGSAIGITQAGAAGNGYLSSTDWGTFNNKVSSTRQINTSAPLAGGGDLSADRTLSIPLATASANGYLSSTDWTTFNSKGAGTVTSVSQTVPSFLTVGGSPITTAGTLAIDLATESSTTVFAGPSTGVAAKPTFRLLVAGDIPALNYIGGGQTLATTAPITGGGTISTGLTLAIPAATTSVSGYLSSTDWNTFNNKVPSTRQIATSAPLAGGGDLSADRTLSIPAATSTANGYLTSTDWTTFNSKGGGTTVYSWKNRIVNGNFDLWNFGSTNNLIGSNNEPISTVCDGWNAQTGINGNITVSQYTIPANQLSTASQTAAIYALNFGLAAHTTNASFPTCLIQPVLHARNWASTVVNLSFWYRLADSASGSTTITPNIWQNSVLTQGNQTTGTLTAFPAFTPSTSTVWTQYSQSITVPTATSTLISTGNDLTALLFNWPSTGTVPNVLFAQVQLEPGSTATDFEFRHPSVEAVIANGFVPSTVFRPGFGFLQSGLAGGGGDVGQPGGIFVRGSASINGEPSTTAWTSGAATDGDRWYNNNAAILSFRRQEAGAQVGEAGMLAVVTSGSLVNNSSTSTITMQSGIIPANFWTPGKTAKIDFRLNYSTAAGSAPILNIGAFVSTAAGFTALDQNQGYTTAAAASGARFFEQLTIICTNTGSTATFLSYGFSVFGGSSYQLNDVGPSGNVTLSTTTPWRIVIVVKLSIALTGDEAQGIAMTVRIGDPPS